jgi:hypothetical protein
MRSLLSNYNTQTMRHKNTQKFYCPHCQKRLWNLGFTQNYKFIFPAKSILFQSYYQFEEFFCEEHGKIKLNVAKSFKQQSTSSTLRIRLHRSKLEIVEQNLKLERVK